MDIGIKLQKARLAANLTQEQVAEALGVSRQTISNWENEKTYPDIKSVIRLSDLYRVSLDHLLKEEAPMSDYLDYLEESTNVVKSRERLSKLIVIAAYLVVWSAAELLFWCFAGSADAMGYSILVFYVLFPVATLALSYIIGVNDLWGRWKWVSPIFFGVMYMLAGYFSFSLRNMIAFQKLNIPDFDTIPFGAIFSLAGLAIGCAARRLKKKK